MENAVLTIIAILTIAFIWLMWLRYSLVSILERLDQKQTILKHDLAQRRDTVPYLLESIRAEEGPDEGWQKILEDRKVFHSEPDMDKEWEFEKELLHFVRDKKLKNINFLEAKKDILDLTALIEKEKQEMDGVMAQFKERKMQFPYSLASAIFGLR